MSCFNKEKPTKEHKRAKERTKEIDAVIKLDKHKSIFKLLLLGTGDSGKSTFAKQMQLIHTEGFTVEKMRTSIPFLRTNTLDTMKMLVAACQNWGLAFSDEELLQVEKVVPAENLIPEIASSVSLLWKSNAVQTAYQQRHRMQLPSGASVTDYYMENAERFADPEFLPTIPDVLRVKLRTISINEITFRVNGTEFLMVDVGGQRSERKKWLTCFHDVSAVIYLVALNEYDMLMEEDDVTNRMEESLKLFQKLSGSQWIRESAMILFLNKYDLFQERIVQRPLNLCFNDYDDYAKKFPHKSELENSVDYIKDQFTKVFNGTRLYFYLTCALDTNNCEKVFLAVRDSIVTKMVGYSF